MSLKSKALLFPILLVMYEISTYLSNDMYLPALPDMMKDLMLTTKQAQWTLTSWFLGSASTPLIMGVISDRYGRRPVLLLGGLVYILTTAICAITHNPHVLLIARFIEGAAIPSMMVAGYACIHESYEQKEAIRILAFMASITILAPALGPLLGSLVLYFSHWRGIFWAITILASIAVLLLFQWMPETHPPEKRHPIHMATLLQQYWRVLTNKQFMLLLCVLGFIYMGFIVWITAGPLLIIDNFHYSPIMFGLMQAFVFAAYIIGNHYVKYFIAWIGVNPLIRLGLIITLCGGMLVGMSAICFPGSIYPFLLGMTTYSLGSALCFAPLNRTVIESSDETMGIRVALFTVIWTCFGVLGSLIASLYFSGTIASIAYPVMAAILVACLMKRVASFFVD